MSNSIVDAITAPSSPSLHAKIRRFERTRARLAAEERTTHPTPELWARMDADARASIVAERELMREIRAVVGSPGAQAVAVVAPSGRMYVAANTDEIEGVIVIEPTRTVIL